MKILFVCSRLPAGTAVSIAIDILIKLNVIYSSLFLILMMFQQWVCLCAEGKWPWGDSATHPLADTQSGGRAPEDQSPCEKGQQLGSWNTEVHLVDNSLTSTYASCSAEV